LTVQLLDKIRPEFVRGVSAAVINLLLDDLQQDRVLNALEVESIREENPARADKARVLIKLVLNKGKKSSEKMINHLIKHDPDFSATLGLC
uniref:CARD domain-containing protein n=1 Tax=Denticeps clupeoides TaxID=299321 RepID=A0AAY4BLK8_9TELE